MLIHDSVDGESATEYIFLEIMYKRIKKKNELINMYKNGEKQAMTGLREQLSFF